MNILKKTSVIILTCITVFSLFIFSSCKKDIEGDTDIYILSEESFNSSFEKLDSGDIKPITETLSEEEYVVEGKRYYAVLLLNSKNLSTGQIKFKGGVTVDGNVLTGSKWDSLFDVQREGTLNEFKIQNENEKGSDNFYVAIPFAVDAYESVSGISIDSSGQIIGLSAEKLSVEFLTYKTVKGKKEETSANKDIEIRHAKSANAISSVRFLNIDGYRNGNEDALKDTLEAAVGEKFYAVIDYKLSDYVGVGELDTLLMTINAKSDDGAVFKINVEDIPAPDYTAENNEIKANFKIHSGAESSKAFRFIISIIPERAGSIKISSSVFASKISVVGDKKAEGSVAVNGNLTLESRLEFELSSDGKYYVLTGLGTEGGDVITVPDTYKGKAVKEIADYVFADIPYLKEVILPSELEKIGAGAFRGENKLKYITVPKSVTTVDSGAFDGFTGKYIYCEAAEKPSEWEEDFAPSDANIVWDHVESYYGLNDDGMSYTLLLYSDTKRENITVAETYKALPVTGIADTAFMMCDKVKRIHISKNITEINFFSHSNLEELTVDAENTVYKCIGDCLIDTRDGTLVSGGNNSVIPTDGSVVKIGNKAFYGCEELTEINIPASVKHIGDEAFYSCEALTKVIFSENGSLETVGKSAFKYCITLSSIILPEGVTEIGESAFENCYLLESVTFGDTLTGIGYRAFYNCHDLAEINYKGSEQEWNDVTKGYEWDKYDDNGSTEDIGYNLKCNYTES